MLSVPLSKKLQEIGSSLEILTTERELWIFGGKQRRRGWGIDLIVSKWVSARWVAMMQSSVLQASMQSRVAGIHSSFCSKPKRVVEGLSTLPGLALSRPSSSVASSAAAARRDLSSSSVYCTSLPLRVCFAGVGSGRTFPVRKPAAARLGESQVNLDDSVESSRRAQVSKRLERTAGYFRRLGSLGFWGQLVCTVVAAIILAFSVVITGAATAPATLYLTTAGIVAAFLSVFWSFGYMRLSQRLRATIDDPTKAPPRAQVVKNLKNGIIINLLGMGATLLGMQATVGVLVAKALTSSAQPFLQGQSPGYSPVLALDVFVVQASANALVSHFLGLVFSLELLRSVTLSQPPPDSVIPKPA